MCLASLTYEYTDTPSPLSSSLLLLSVIIAVIIVLLAEACRHTGCRGPIIIALQTSFDTHLSKNCCRFSTPLFLYPSLLTQLYSPTLHFSVIEKTEPYPNLSILPCSFSQANTRIQYTQKISQRRNNTKEELFSITNTLT